MATHEEDLRPTYYRREREGATVPNHLAEETSPYLLQHANNPVDWYPWGPEALRRAREEDKPIFLSIGYSACHWCHVMERESFTDPLTADFLNDHFVSIKVDREERPDLDAIYMEAVTSITGRGGWPLSAWLTPAGAPFYGGTYFPESPRFGSPSFLQVLKKLAETWETRREEIEEAAATLLAHLRSEEGEPEGQGPPATSPPGRVLERAFPVLHGSHDSVNGGWGVAPKFPQPLVIEALLAHLTQKTALQLKVETETTLDAMAAGGIYDHLGGGFHRYSTDVGWLVPHFEKMLYDNAQLARCYLHAWQVFRKPRYRAVAEETLDYLLREMSHPDGGLFSAQDADSEGMEGAFFVWDLGDVRGALSPEEADLMVTTYGMTQQGNFEGANILHLAVEPAEDDLHPLGTARAKLLAARDSRVHPARDEKVLAGWNGLALAALAEAARALPSERYREAAERTGDFVLRDLLRPGYRVFHSWKDGRASGEGFLDDYACLVEGLLALYQTTFAERWFVAARGLTDTMIEYFRRPEGGLYDTSSDHETLITRPRSLQDSPTPSGNSMATTVLLKMAGYTGESAYLSFAEQTLGAMAPLAERAPLAFGQWLTAYHLAGGLIEIAVVGHTDHPRTADLLSVVNATFRPSQIVAARPPGAASAIPLLAGREPRSGDHAAAWVCRNSTCAAPTADPEELRALLGGPSL